MRYIIQHAATDSLHAPAVMTGYAAFIADNHQQAQAMFAEKHPDRTVIKIIPVFDEKAAFSLYGLGAYTEEEQQEYRENLAVKMAETRRELSDIEARLLEYSPEEFTAELDHRESAVLRRRLHKVGVSLPHGRAHPRVAFQVDPALPQKFLAARLRQAVALPFRLVDDALADRIAPQIDFPFH